MGYFENLAWAQKAIAFVKKHTPLGPSNKVSSGMATSKIVREEMKVYLNAYSSNLARDRPDLDVAKSSELNIAFIAAMTMRFGAGNCGEQAALAFIFLRDQQVFPIDYIEKPDLFLNYGGHAFVVIGRKQYSDPNNVDEWGEEAVVCDPHQEEKAFPARDLPRYFGTPKGYVGLRLVHPSIVSVPVGEVRDALRRP